MISLKRLYAGLAVVGLLVPYAFFATFLISNGLNLSLFLSEMFANSIASFFAADVLISAIAFFVFVRSEGRKHAMKSQWVYVLATLLVGVSFALPLFLYVRQGYLEKIDSRE